MSSTLIFVFRFYLKCGIPGVIGCIDASHFRISAPPENEKHLFYNPEDYHSLNVQMICDDKHRILDVNPKFGGEIEDSFIWESSCINNYLQTLDTSWETVCLLGDSGYSLSPWLLTPYSDTVPGSIEDNFNTKHRMAHMTIDNTFGRLRKNWQCLSKDSILQYQPVMCAKIIIACCVLHNLALDFNVLEPDFKKWAARSDDKLLKDSKKKKMTQEEFRERTGLLIDIVKQGFGTTNDGNTARRFFTNFELSAEITGIHPDLIKRYNASERPARQWMYHCRAGPIQLQCSNDTTSY